MKISARGYTIVEILIVLAIIGLTSIAGIAGYQEYTKRQTLKSVMNKVKADVKYASELALSGTKPSECEVDPDNPLDDLPLDGYQFEVVPDQTYRIYASCNNGDVRILISQKQVNSIVKLTPPDINPVLFKSIGHGTNIPSGDSVQITITSNQSLGYDSTININSAGNIE